MLDESAVAVEWEEPFTWHDFPITNYTVEVFNQTSEELLAHDVVSADMHSYNHTRSGPQHHCSNFVICVNASNGVGTSSSGCIHGSFPTRKQICDCIRAMQTASR